MLTVYLVDNQTRIILPGSAWGTEVLAKLSSLGHQIQATDQEPSTIDRDDAEMTRMEELLDKTDCFES